MKKPVKIMHIDSDYQAHYIIVQNGSLIHSLISLQKAVEFLRKLDFDLILSEPHKKAILQKGNPDDGKNISELFASGENNRFPNYPA